ncbi:hypothetical protein JJD41_08585 [Oxynema sp. CENA135]|uniref:hypothetical protein n=1 Tax=Oxynema sp. CENA135 TaxID=984206 RepID=UPI001909A3B5|nr:hypothetical protein [Oxynema sp. CENA135]MBK4729918.1 hypothetical protein [Oxynema sp. CENA135]
MPRTPHTPSGEFGSEAIADRLRHRYSLGQGSGGSPASGQPLAGLTSRGDRTFRIVELLGWLDVQIKDV